MKYISCVLIFLLSLAAGWPAAGQGGLVVEPGNVIHPDLLFDRFNSNNGLPDNRIRSVYQDRQGFLWIGTMNGIAKTDGYTFRKFYKTRQRNSISGNWVHDLAGDKADNLWIGTPEGLNRLDTRTETFTVYKNNPANANSLLHNVVRTLSFDRYGKLWIGTPQGLCRLDPATNTFKHYPQYPLNTAIGKIIPSHGDFIWVATRDGLVHYNVKSEQYTFYKLQVKPNPYGDRFWSLLEDNKDLYIATGGDGLIRLPYDHRAQAYGAFQVQHAFSGSSGQLDNTEIYDIGKSRSGDFWLGTGRGLARIQYMGSARPRLTFFRNNPVNSQSISNDRIYKVFIDKTQVLWCGTELGLNKLDLQLLHFRYYTFTDPRAKEQIRSIYSRDGVRVWLGSSVSGFFRYNLLQGTTEKYQFRPQHSFRNHHRSILEDEQGGLWLGTLGGAIRLPPGRAARYQEWVKGLTIFSLFQDSRKNVWIGTNNGLYRISPQGGKTDYTHQLKKPKGIRTWYVRSIYEDHRGHIWLGLENGGINRYDPQTGAFTEEFAHDPQQQITGKVIFSILEHPRNVFWIGSEAGLNRVTAGPEKQGRRSYTLRTYLEEDGLPDKSVNGILADRQGNLWISTIKGLVRFHIRQERFQHFLPNLSFNYSSYHQANPHTFLFGTTDGFVVFNPGEISTNTYSPEVVLTGLRLFNNQVETGIAYHGDVVLKQAISHTRSVTLNYRNNSFTIGFAALHFSNPEGNQYAYKMEGFDKNWIHANASSRSATYTNLDPGTYHFLVKASNSAGRWNQVPTVLEVKVLPPPWKTWWAMAGYFLLFNGLLFLFVRYVLIQSRQRQQLRFEQREKEQLKSLNQMKLRFFTDISHEFRTPLSLIVGPVEELLQSPGAQGEVRQKLALINRNCRKLLYLIDELMTFQKMDQGKLPLRPVWLDMGDFVRELYASFQVLAARNDIRFSLEVAPGPLPACLDPGKIEMVLNNLLFNAFKFTPPAGSIAVAVQQATAAQQGLFQVPAGRHWLWVSVQDSGRGMSPEEQQHIFQPFYQADSSRNGTGLGLALTKSLVELHQGHIAVESAPNQGTCFRVLLPCLPEILAGPGQATPAAAVTPGYDVSAFVAGEPEAEALAAEAGEETLPRLLIVDDNPELLEFLDMLFRGHYQVMRAANGRQALELVEQQEPDLVISDVMMPEMDGIALCEKLKSDILTCHIPLVLLTARATVEHTMQGFQTGADDYIPKPFNPDLLRVRVKRLLDARRQLIAKYQAAAMAPYQDGAAALPAAQEPEVKMSPLDEAFLKKVNDLIFQQLSNDEFSVEEMGSEVGMSRSNLFRKLKAITGKTPIEYIYFIRLNHARELLLEGKLNVSEVAYEVGFRNPSSFSKSFRKQFGKAPTEYLQQMGKEPA